MSTPATTNSKPEVSPPEPGLRLAARSGLDVMLSDAVLEADDDREAHPAHQVREQLAGLAGCGRPSITTAAARSPASSADTAAMTNTSPMRACGHAIASPPALNNSSSTHGRHRGGRDQFRHTIVCDRCFQVTDSRQACLAARSELPLSSRSPGCDGVQERGVVAFLPMGVGSRTRRRGLIEDV
jgi:hypothetical protein